jgi:hypothetical protein
LRCFCLPLEFKFTAVDDNDRVLRSILIIYRNRSKFLDNFVVSANDSAKYDMLAYGGLTLKAHVDFLEHRLTI